MDEVEGKEGAGVNIETTLRNILGYVVWSVSPVQRLENCVSY